MHWHATHSNTPQHKATDTQSVLHNDVFTEMTDLDCRQSVRRRVEYDFGAL